MVVREDSRPSLDRSDTLARTFTLRASRTLVLGAVAMAAVAWMVTLPGVLAALACGSPLALAMRRFARLRAPAVATAAAAAAGALAGSLGLGHGVVATRLLAACIATLAVAPWLLVLGFVRWARRGAGMS